MFLGSWRDGAVIARFLPYLRKQIGNYKIVIDQGFTKQELVSGILWDQSQKLYIVLIAVFEIIS